MHEQQGGSQVGIVTKVASVGGCSGQYESRLGHECHLVLGVPHYDYDEVL